ncbi:UNVERIFIED_CONTAM: hypothetical protein FKN15_068219, partial [Acipenser sinensis]
GALGAGIARLARRVYSDESSSFVCRVTLDAFLCSLEPAELRHQVRHTNPASLDQAIDRATAIETVLQDQPTPEHCSTSQSVSRTQASLRGERDHDKENRELPTAKRRVPTHERGHEMERICWHCGEPGHVMADCCQLEAKLSMRQPLGNGSRSKQMGRHGPPHPIPPTHCPQQRLPSWGAWEKETSCTPPSRLKEYGAQHLDTGSSIKIIHPDVIQQACTDWKKWVTTTPVHMCSDRRAGPDRGASSPEHGGTCYLHEI